VLIDKQGGFREEFARELNWDSGEYRTVGREIEALRAEKQTARK